MKSGWWKIQFSVTLDGIEIDFDELPVEVKRRVLRQVAQGAVAGAIDYEDTPGNRQ